MEAAAKVPAAVTVGEALGSRFLCRANCANAALCRVLLDTGVPHARACTEGCSQSLPRHQCRCPGAQLTRAHHLARPRLVSTHYQY